MCEGSEMKSALSDDGLEDMAAKAEEASAAVATAAVNTVSANDLGLGRLDAAGAAFLVSNCALHLLLFVRTE